MLLAFQENIAYQHAVLDQYNLVPLNPNYQAQKRQMQRIGTVLDSFTCSYKDVLGVREVIVNTLVSSTLLQIFTISICT